ncbi:MAG TPA: hypothetical protein PKC91_03400 [Ignavibacteria bacterium]|nr:hypothetical protein [Ignavibacteria bacterium]
MKSDSDRNYLYITAASIFSCIVYLIFEHVFTHGQMGVPLDDTWIHFQFADNFAKGFFFQFNSGEYTAGTTSPLYVIVLGSMSFLIKNFIVSSVFLSSIFFLLSCIFIYKISLKIFTEKSYSGEILRSTGISPEYISLIIALLTAFTGRIVWSALSGMETTMFMMFCLLGIYFHVKSLQSGKFSLLPALFISLATVSRPEGFLLYGLYMFDLTANLIKVKAVKANILNLFLSLLIFILITFPYLIFSYGISGHFFPNTFRGQGGGLSLIPNFTYLRIALVYFFRDNFITGSLYIFSLIFYVYNIKKYFNGLKLLNLMFLWTLLLPVVMSVLIPNWRHHVRYLIPILPFVNLISIYLIFRVLDANILVKLKELFCRKKNVLAVIILFSFTYYVVYAVALGKNTDNINSQQVKLAEWVGNNVGRNEVIALNDIGAITFLNKNRIIDMAGLVTPEILRYRTYNWNDNLDSINYLLKKNNVSYIIIYDHWFKEYLDKYGSTLTYITSAILEDNTICGGVEMKVYKTNFKSKKD